MEAHSNRGFMVIFINHKVHMVQIGQTFPRFIIVGGLVFLESSKWMGYLLLSPKCHRRKTRTNP